MAGAFEVLAATLCQRQSAFQLEKSNYGFELSKISLPTSDPDALSSLSQSVLGCVIGISRAQIEDRENNIDLFDEGESLDLWYWSRADYSC